VSAYGRKLRHRSGVWQTGKVILLASLAVVLAAFLLWPKAQAREASNVDTIMQIAQVFGTARLDRDSNSSPRISAELDGFAYTITFFDCGPSDTCSSAQFVTHFDVMADQAKLDQWNGQTAGPRAYFDAMGGTSLAQTTQLDDAPGPAIVMGMIGNWGNAVFDFAALIDP